MNLLYPDSQLNLVTFDSLGDAKECPIMNLKVATLNDLLDRLLG